jgi:hypothetical protein
VEDDHVDRPGVEVRQRMELTGTNRSIGLIVLIINARQGGTKRPFASICVSPAWWPSAKRSDPIPSRTRPSNASAPMVLCLKTWESRSSPGLPNTSKPSSDPNSKSAAEKTRRFLASFLGAGWSSPVARQAHNLKVAGSNPAPASKSCKIWNNAPHSAFRLEAVPCVRHLFQSLSALKRLFRARTSRANGGQYGRRRA